MFVFSHFPSQQRRKMSAEDGFGDDVAAAASSSHSPSLSATMRNRCVSGRLLPRGRARGLRWVGRILDPVRPATPAPVTKLRSRVCTPYITYLSMYKKTSSLLDFFHLRRSFLTKWWISQVGSGSVCVDTVFSLSSVIFCLQMSMKLTAVEVRHCLPPCSQLWLVLWCLEI